MSKLDTNDKTMLALGAALPVFVILLVTVLAVWEGWVIAQLWAWHFVPLGLPALPLGASVAGNMIVSLLTLHMRPNRDAGTSLWPTVAAPAVALVVGWLLR